MKPASSIQPPPHIVEEAALWVVQLSSPDSTQEDRSACDRWCQEHPDHRLAFERLQALDARIGKTGAVERAALNRLRPDGEKQRYRLSGAALAILGLFFVSAPWVQSIWHRHFPDHETAIGEIRSASLSDGSQLTLDTASALSVKLSQEQREISLYRGRLLAKVAHGKAPFVVETADGTATALGTVFTVSIDGQGTVVTVVQSHVRACSADRCETLAPGEQARMSAAGIVRLPNSDPDMAASWAEGWLAVDDRPVAEVILNLNRYRQNPIRFNHASLSAVHVSGSFPLGDTDRTLEAVAEAANLRLSKSPDGSIDVARK